MKESELQSLFISTDHTIQEAALCIDRNQTGLALVVDEDRRLLGTVSDGDLRRAVLDQVDLHFPVTVLLQRKKKSPYSRPITAEVGAEPKKLLSVMKKNVIRQIPLIDSEGRVADLILMRDLLPNGDSPMQAVIMAGGFGTRLRPLTENLPKPMLPVGGRPLMELTLERLREAGIHQVNVTTHYKQEKIVEHFGDGKDFGVDLKYVQEDEPLGTGGALSLMTPPKEPLLVINGDIVTEVNFRDMLAFHREHEAIMTVAVRHFGFKVPYGVVECDGAKVCRLQEKPELKFLVNAGIYLLDPAVFQYIPSNRRFDITDLIDWLLEDGRPVISFPIREYWIDIGRYDDYVQAQEDAQNKSMEQ